MAASAYFQPTTTIVEGRHTGEYIKSEANGARSRDNAVIAAGSGIVIPGQVLGRVTASGKLVPLTAGATDGSNVAAAINYAHVDATASDINAAVTARDSEVYSLRLTWDPSISGTPANMTTATKQLAALGIVLR